MKKISIIISAMVLVFAGLVVVSRYSSKHSCSSCSDHCCSGVAHIDDDTATFSGCAQLHDRTFGNLIVNGSATAEVIVVKDKFVVNGCLSATKLQGNHVRVNGAAVFKDCSLAGLTSISGILQADKTVFTDIILAGERGEFTACTIKKITIRSAENDKAQKIILKDSVVEGDIIFEKEGGEVMLKDGAHVLGDVVGGTIKD